MATDRKLLSNGMIHIPRTKSFGSNSDDIDAFGQVVARPRIVVSAAALDAVEDYYVKFTRSFLRYSFLSPPTTYPTAWVSIEDTNFPGVEYEWDVTSDGGGAISNEILIIDAGWDSTSVLTTQSSSKLKKNAGVSESYVWGTLLNDVYDPDPDKNMEGRALGYSLPTPHSEGGHDYLLYPAVFETEWTMELRRSSDNLVISSKQVNFNTILALDENTDDTENIIQDLFDVVVDLSAAADPIQSPALLDIDINRAIIPYNNTTEREVVHMDYRVKNGELIQNSLRELVIPYTVDDMTTLRISTAGGSTIPVTTTVDNGDGTTTVTASQDVVGTFYVGTQYEMQYKLGNLQIKPANSDGRTRNTNRATKDNLSTMTFAYADSRVFDVEITRPNRPVRVVEFVSTRIGFDDIGEAGLSTGTFRFHVRGKTDVVIITVKDNSVFPLQLQHVEIERNVTSRSKR